MNTESVSFFFPLGLLLLLLKLFEDTYCYTVVNWDILERTTKGSTVSQR